MTILYKEELVSIPENCQVEFNDKIMTVKGPRCTVVKDLSHFILTLDIHDGSVRCRLWNANSRQKSKLNTCASIIRNTILGTTKGFSYTLKAAFKHFPISMEVHDEGKTVFIKNFLGRICTRKFGMIGDSVARLGEEKDTLVIEGSSIEDVSQSAGNIQNDCSRAKKYDTRIFLDGIYVSKKGTIESL